MKDRFLIRWFAAPLVILISGCTVLAPVADDSRFYVLSSDLDSAGGASFTANTARPNLAVGVGPVHVPEYLQRPGVATRVGPTRIEYSATDRWAEPLNDCIPRVLAQDLSRSLGTDRVILFPWNRALHVDYQVEVSIDRFDLDSNDTAELSARWFIKNPITGQILDSGSTHQTAAGGKDAASRTAALSQILNLFGNELAQQVQRLASQSPGSMRS